MMTQERRREILNILKNNAAPQSATSISKKLGVSRQIIVGDVALLRAEGEKIIATPRGYVLEKEEENLIRSILVACKHDGLEAMKQELYIIVDHGCYVEDVIVSHPIYGQLSGKLALSSRYDVDEFCKKVQKESAHSLSELTDGLHLHTLKANDEDILNRTKEALKNAGFLYYDIDK